MIEYPYASPAEPVLLRWMAMIHVNEYTGFPVYGRTEKEANDDAAKEIARLKES